MLLAYNDITEQHTQANKSKACDMQFLKFQQQTDSFRDNFQLQYSVLYSLPTTRLITNNVSIISCL